MTNMISLFDYNALAADVATELRGTAERVRARFKRATSDIIENGRDLLQVKARLKHGEFTAWVETELGMSARAAQMMMRMAEVADKESEKFSLLQPSVALKLAAPSVPAEVRTAFVERAAAGERVPVAVVDRELQRIREVKASAGRAAKSSDRVSQHQTTASVPPSAPNDEVAELREEVARLRVERDQAHQEIEALKKKLAKALSESENNYEKAEIALVNAKEAYEQRDKAQNEVLFLKAANERLEREVAAGPQKVDPAPTAPVAPTETVTPPAQEAEVDFSSLRKLTVEGSLAERKPTPAEIMGDIPATFDRRRKKPSADNDDAPAGAAAA